MHGHPTNDRVALLNSMFRVEHYFQHSIFMYRKLWQRVGGYNNSITFGEDLDLCAKFLLDGKSPLYLRTVSHIHRNHSDSLTHNYTYHASVVEVRDHYSRHREALKEVLGDDQIHYLDRFYAQDPLPKARGSFHPYLLNPPPATYLR